MTGNGAILALVLTVAVVGCQRDRDREEPAILAWLDCIECTEQDRQAVVALGERAVGGLGDVLEAPLQGERRVGLERQLNARFTEIGDPSLDRGTYVDRYMANYEASDAKRAAAVLGDLGASYPEAIDHLRTALRESELRQYRGDVVATLQRELNRSAPGVSGTISSSVQTFDGTGVPGVTVELRRCLRPSVAPGADACDAYGSTTTRDTDASGSASFTGVVEGVWDVRVSPGTGRATPTSQRVVLTGAGTVIAVTFRLGPSITVSGIADSTTNTGQSGWTISGSGPGPFPANPVRVRLRRVRALPSAGVCYAPDTPFTWTPVPCADGAGDVQYQADDGVVTLDLTRIPGPSEGYWTLDAFVLDQAGISSDTTTRITLNDVTAPDIGAISAPPAIAGAAAVSFSVALSDTGGLAASTFSLMYADGSEVSIDGPTRSLGTYGLTGGLTGSQTETVSIARFMRSVEPTGASGRAGGTVKTAVRANFHVADVAGNVSDRHLDILGAVVAGAGGALPTLADVDANLFAPTVAERGRFILQPPSNVELCSSRTGCGPDDDLATTLSVTMTGPSGTSDPLDVEYYYQDPLTNHWVLIGTVTNGMATDDGSGTRTWTYSLGWTVTGLRASDGTQLLGNVHLAAIGVHSSGSAIISLGTPRTVTLTAD